MLAPGYDRAMAQYPIADELQHAGRHCATIARLKFSDDSGRRFLPAPDEPTATVTFIDFGEKTYAVTAKHVIDIFTGLSETAGCWHEGYFVPAKPGSAILGPFITPPSPSLVGLHVKVDVAICPVDPRLPGHVGKTAFKVEPSGDAQWPLTHALAVGFPTDAKADVHGPGGYRLGMRCVHALAESVGGSPESDQVQFYSDLPERIDHSSLSGMSGGPVFWSTEASYGLLGFIKEALDVVSVPGEETIYNGPRVNFICSRVDYRVLTDWFHHVDVHWQAARDQLNAKA